MVRMLPSPHPDRSASLTTLPPTIGQKGEGLVTITPKEQRSVLRSIYELHVQDIGRMSINNLPSHEGLNRAIACHFFEGTETEPSRPQVELSYLALTSSVMKSAAITVRGNNSRASASSTDGSSYRMEMCVRTSRSTSASRATSPASLAVEWP